MILVVTHKEDYTADFLINKLNQSRTPYYRFNCEDVLENKLSIKLENNLFSMSERYKSVWFRRTRLPTLSSLDDSTKEYIYKEVDAYFSNLWDIINAKWVSIPSNVYKAESKLYQLKVATEIGLTVPKTLASFNKEEIYSFYKSNNNGTIIKPLQVNRIFIDDSPHNIFTNKLTDELIQNLDRYLLTPVIYQENILKDIELRVTVVEEDVFCAAVYSQEEQETKQDWRRKKLRFFEYQLPEDIQEKCISLVKKLGLSFGAIDLIKNTSGNYIFLEINPNGQWAWIEFDTGLKISDSIIKSLTS